MEKTSCGIKAVPKNPGRVRSALEWGVTTTLKGNILEVQLKWLKIWTLSCLMSNIKVNETGMTPGKNENDSAVL